MNIEEIIKLIHTEKFIDNISVKIKLLGKEFKNNVYELLTLRLIVSILLFIVFWLLLDFSIPISLIVGVSFYILFIKIVLDSKINKRCRLLEKEAIHFFEVLTLSLETGRNLIEAINVTTDHVDGKLSQEFKEAVREVTFGKSLSESLKDMQERIPSETINNIILSLTESNVFGNSMVKDLYRQVEYLREKRKMEVKGKISKVPIYISVISVFFFVPLLLLIILGPVILEYFG